MLHTNAQNISENEEVVIPLFNAGNKIWLEHDNKKADVVLIPVNLDRNRYVLHILDESYIESSNLDIKIEKIFVMGYPFGWYDNVNNLPITRIGHLSSPFKVPFQNKPFMLGDVQTHKGMSGGPVLMYLKDFVTIDANGNRTMNIGASRTLLVGINSATVNWPIGNETVLSGLIIIWFPELILEILQQN
ncbi:MAG: hypothetical protein NT120_04745 [Candidatus Aenigmarchaeota archaeon]|nr:hypothetical protein [Candidatus Aenigmarchaeota archaeon]